MKVKMNFTKKSMVSGKEYTKTLNVDPADILKWQGGMLIQRALPYLTPDEREFLMTGITAEEWEGLFRDADQ